ncbi:hypothetical protein TWF730_008565 [Orbilia blumenaviensis]|uniref:Uncharacterized protein n=1 Tax=Orbilia blumenaviensis TaxID=1796055 RepID=A0AAV9V3F6_9PEZI
MGFEEYDAKCAEMTIEQLQLEWEHYTRVAYGSGTSTAVAGLAIPFTLGVSILGMIFSAPINHNARKKREIIETHFKSRGETPVTRKRDTVLPVVISGTVGVVGIGVSAVGAEAILANGVEYGVQAAAEEKIAAKVVSHVAVDAVAVSGEHAHARHKRAKQAEKRLA